MPYVDVRDVCKELKRVRVLDHVSFHVNRGEVVGLEGANGSGKTMAMRVAVGLVIPQSGEVCIDGRALGKDMSFPPSVGLLIEEPSVLESYSALNNLRLVASIREVASEDDLCSALERVGLDPENRKRVSKFSLGMRQRLGLAMALMERPDLLVLDEPTNALDESGRVLLAGIVEEERNRGAAMLLSSHDAEFLDEVCDRLYHMRDGRVVGWKEVRHARA